jgi:hypothetical protein
MNEKLAKKKNLLQIRILRKTIKDLNKRIIFWKTDLETRFEELEEVTELKFKAICDYLSIELEEEFRIPKYNYYAQPKRGFAIKKKVINKQ